MWLTACKGQNSKTEGEKIESKWFFYPAWVCDPVACAYGKLGWFLASSNAFELCSAGGPVWLSFTSTCFIFQKQWNWIFKGFLFGLFFTVVSCQRSLRKRWAKNVIFIKSQRQKWTIEDLGSGSKLEAKGPVELRTKREARKICLEKGGLGTGMLHRESSHLFCNAQFLRYFEISLSEPKSMI